MVVYHHHNNHNIKYSILKIRCWRLIKIIVLYVEVQGQGLMILLILSLFNIRIKSFRSCLNKGSCH